MIYFNHHLFDWRWLVNYCWWMVIDTAAEILSQKKVLNTNFSKQKLSHGIWWNHDLKAVVLSHLPLKEWRLQNQPIVKVNSEQKRNWLIVVRESRKWEGNSQSWEKLNLIHRLPYQAWVNGREQQPFGRGGARWKPALAPLSQWDWEGGSFLLLTENITSWG